MQRSSKIQCYRRLEAGQKWKGEKGTKLNTCTILKICKMLKDIIAQLIIICNGKDSSQSQQNSNNYLEAS